MLTSASVRDCDFYRSFYLTGRVGLLSTGSAQRRPAAKVLVKTVLARSGRSCKPSESGGRGLIGLRERIGLYGGELDAGPRPGGGWRVRARIPVEGSARVGGRGEGGESAGPVRPKFLAAPR